MSDTLAELRDYQRKGVAWLREHLTHNKAVLLCDDPGLGKTVQALGAARELAALRILIICPAGARRVWSNEITRWFPAWRGRVVLVEPGTAPGQIQKRLALANPIILIVGYDEMSRQESRIPSLLETAAWDLMIVDEAHYLKNPSNRTKAIYGPAGTSAGIQTACDRVILLTGTPTPNHAGELFHHVRTFWPGTIFLPRKNRAMTLGEFEERYTRYRDTVYGRQVTGSKNQAELRVALQEVVLRRRKDEVLPELPPLILQDVPLEQDPQDQRTGIGLSTNLAGRLSWSLKGTNDAQLLKLLQTPDPAITTMRRELGELKVKLTIAWVQERLFSVSKILVFAWHHSVIEHLRRGLADFDPVVITGETSPAGRTNAIELFQRRAGVRVFIGQVLAAGTAITLTAASEVAIVEPSWVPGENVQAICRAHRLGQRDCVVASFLYLPGTLDERIMFTFRRKAAEIAQLQGDDFYARSDQPDFRSDRDRRREPGDQPAGRSRRVPGVPGTGERSQGTKRHSPDAGAGWRTSQPSHSVG